jgi:FKBP-type peptidyl-prolyl cis-trans isomerase FklB
MILRTLIAFGLIVCCPLVADGQDEKLQLKLELKSFVEKSSYGLGLSIGRDLLQQGMEINSELLIKGIQDGLSKTTPQLTDEELQAVMLVYQRELEKRQVARWQESAKQNLEKGEAFLKANASKQGVKSLESGLQYKVVKSAGGAPAKITDQVKVHFRGMRTDESEFDSSYKTGMPAQVTVGASLRAWSDALQKMSVGDKWIIYVPASLGYGPDGLPPLIGPNEVVVFELELVEIIK